MTKILRNKPKLYNIMKQKIFTLFLALAASVGTIFADGTKIGDLYYNLDATNKTAEVTSQNSEYPYWSATIATANIPSSVDYESVTYEGFPRLLRFDISHHSQLRHIY